MTLTSSENIDSDGKTYDCSFTNGSVVVASGKMGDVNENGFVTSIDARYALQYVVGDKELTESQLIVADMNGDGKVNNRDAARLMQYLAGWEVDCVEPALDANGDGRVNVVDINEVVKNYTK